MFGINARAFAVTLGAVALLAAAGGAPRAVAAATLTTAPGATLHQYVGYGYYGFPSPFTPFQSQAVNYPGSGAAAWLGYSAPYSTSGYPYGGLAYPYLAYANPAAAYAYGSAAGGPYSGGPGNPYTAYGAGYGNAAGPTAAGPSTVPQTAPGTYWDNTGYYVIP